MSLGPRLLKPMTRIRYLVRDLRITRQMLRIVAGKLSAIARGQETGQVVLNPSEIRELSSECERIAHRCDGW